MMPGPSERGGERPARARRRDGPPALERFIAAPALRFSARRAARADPATLWRAAQATRLSETALLGPLIRWRIPGTPARASFGELFRSAPFVVLEEDERALVSGLAGRIWSRDLAQLGDAEEFARFCEPGAARVVFAHWAASRPAGGAVLCSEVRVEALGRAGALGVAAVRPLVASFGYLVGSEGLAVAVRAAERGR
jgi:hypothetical protein